jgi:hypothetical protein
MRDILRADGLDLLLLPVLRESGCLDLSRLLRTLRIKGSAEGEADEEVGPGVGW